MKALILISLLFFACSEDNDPQPVKSCAQLKSEIELAQKAILDHQAKGSNGDPEAWENELNRLNHIKTEKSNEYAKRAC
jgi:hypothetical protein